MREKAEITLGNLLLLSLVATTISITPLWSLDPINPIKMLAVSAVGFMGLGVLLANQKVLELGRYKLPLLLISGFMGWQMVVFVVSGGEKFQQLFGTTGRNTGLITYLAFSILFVVAMAASSADFLNRMFMVIVFVGVLSLGYGVVQALGGDPFDWVNPYSPVFGFLGNPNFQSSLLGIFGAIVFTRMLSVPAKIHFKFASFLYFVLTIYVINETGSQQGFLVLLIGAGVSLGIYLIFKSRALGFVYLIFAGVGFLGILLGTLDKGPLASILYKSSVAYRGDYWRAGWKMTLENPLFGVGLDNYGDWYRRSRDLTATIRTSPDRVSNAAHNVFLDISAFGGFPLFVIYLSLMVLVLISAVKVIKREQGFNATFVGLVAGWVGFQAQSIISINQIGLAIWGWVLSGLIIGYEFSTRGDSSIIKGKKIKGSIQRSQNSAATSTAIFIGLVVGVLIGMPPYLASAKYKAAIETRDARVIQEAAYIWPLDSSRMTQVARILDRNNLGDQGLRVALDAVNKFPNDFNAWATLGSMKKTTNAQKKLASIEMKRLDPLNPDLK
jgi:O-antigen ligase